jgi:hypothetical protein
MVNVTIQTSDNGAIERKIVTYMITSAEFIQAILPIYQPRLLLEIPRRVAGWCLAFHDKHGRQAPLEHIQTLFQVEKPTMHPDEAGLVEMFLAGINQEYEGQGEGEFNLSFAVDMTAKHFRRRAIEMHMEDLAFDLEGGNIEAAYERESKFKAAVAVQQDLGRGYTGPELLDARFPEPKWVVNDLLPQGFSPLCGPPKVGKSWLALNLALSIATGQKFLERYDVVQGEALYLDYELPDTKLRGRLEKCLNGRHDLPGLESLHLQPKGSWPRIHEGGLEMLQEFMDKHPDLRVVVIDVWRKFSRPRKPQEENSYNLTYEDVGPVKDFADSRGICVVVLHHLAKGWRSYENPFEAFLGSTALAGASDNLLALVKGSEEADGVLWATGRDIEESQTALEFDKEDFTWKFLGDANQFELTQDQNAIAQAIAEMGEASPKDIAAAVGKSGNSVREMLFRMLRQGRVEKGGYGRYRLPNTTNSTNTINSPNSPNTSPSKEEVLGELGIRSNRTISRPPTPTKKTSPGEDHSEAALVTQKHVWRMCAEIQDEFRRKRY